MLILNRWECAITSIITNEGAEGEDGPDGKTALMGRSAYRMDAVDLAGLRLIPNGSMNCAINF